MHYLITGHSGFIGSELIRILNLEIRNYSLIYREGVEPKLPCLLDKNEDIVLLHLAGLAHRNASYDELYEANVTYLVNTIKKTNRAYNLKKILFLSSVAVYGLHESEKVIDENSLLHSDDAYGAVKIIAESKIAQLSQQYHFDYVILRPPLVYGAGSPGNLSQLKKWGERVHLLPLGLARSERTMICVTDLARAIIISADHPTSLKMAFNVCEDKGLSTKTLMENLQLKNYYSLPIPIIIMKWFLLAVGKKKLYQQLYGQRLFSNKLITEVTGWKPKFNALEHLDI